MILIIDCTRQDIPLLIAEFARPLQTIIQTAEFETSIQPLKTNSLPGNTKGIIISGTALLDQQFLQTGLPSCLEKWDGPLLGICAGMQLLALKSGGMLTHGEKIGMTDVTVVSEDPLFSGNTLFSAWELHQSEVRIPDSLQVLARSSTTVQAFRLKNKPRYGTLFHPEVRNEWIIHNFLQMCNR
jgi:GMP synthase (glutamine-hydrolysing)